MINRHKMKIGITKMKKKILIIFLFVISTGFTGLKVQAASRVNDYILQNNDVVKIITNNN